MQLSFSERELGSKQRSNYSISVIVWNGILSFINSSLQNSNFAQNFPDECPDGGSICGTNHNDFVAALQAEIPEIKWPLELDDQPAVVYIMDLIEFCFHNFSKAIQGTYHSYFHHYHFSFNKEVGQMEFAEKINRIFSRNGIGYELNVNGVIERLIDPVLKNEIDKNYIYSSDSGLNELIKSAINKFHDKNPKTRKESLEKLWDAWERIKTIYPELDKKRSLTKMLEKVSPEISFRDTLDTEAKELTRIGNNFGIRHSETSQVALEKNQHVDYLFHRLYSMINLILKSL
jgi:hypothetical protein